MKKLFFLFFILMLTISSSDIHAQCAMCKANVESNLKEGGSIGSALNPAIIYLMIAPYLLLMTGFYFFFREKINKKVATLVASFKAR